MARLSRTLAFVLRFVVAGLALAFVIGLAWPGAGTRLRARLGLAPPPAASAPALPVTAGPVSYAEAVQRAAPAVVNIYANKVVTERMRIYPDPLMQRLFGGVALGPAYQRREQSLGSGVIFSNDGYVLTNNHVISGADDIQVLLYDNRVAQAKVVGTDADTDLAVLKIDASHLPQIAMSEHSRPQVGDVVLAIGNPFGLNQTVTMGIVSAIGRQFNSSLYEDLIQTDAAINSGNSGGALVNAHGELVGINTAIGISRGASAEGIGFAIPVGTAKTVLDQIVAHGRVVRGWIGADYRPIPLPINGAKPVADHGVVVLGVYPGSPAASAGLQAGDILLTLDGKPIADPIRLRAEESRLKPGTKITLGGARAGVSFQVQLELVQRPEFSRGSGSQN
ncbi:MAG TPA: trypsin-like peptidase domain-containing protein [Rhodanobacteraceae bacterium]|nr:trypsin-like peptidase domain-containing protein [Rhodanobacteraceae bacterium]